MSPDKPIVMQFGGKFVRTNEPCSLLDWRYWCALAPPVEYDEMIRAAAMRVVSAITVATRYCCCSVIIEHGFVTAAYTQTYPPGGSTGPGAESDVLLGDVGKSIVFCLFVFSLTFLL